MWNMCHGAMLNINKYKDPIMTMPLYSWPTKQPLSLHWQFECAKKRSAHPPNPLIYTLYASARPQATKHVQYTVPHERDTEIWTQMRSHDGNRRMRKLLGWSRRPTVAERSNNMRRVPVIWYFRTLRQTNDMEKWAERVSFCAIPLVGPCQRTGQLIPPFRAHTDRRTIQRLIHIMHSIMSPHGMRWAY